MATNTVPDENTNTGGAEEDLIEHIFCLDLEEIKLIHEVPTECTIGYTYELFQTSEFSTLPFKLNCEKKYQEIPDSSYKQYIISSRTKRSEIKHFLEKNLLIINIFSQGYLFGKATFDLSNLLNGKAENMSFGPRYRKKERILSGQQKDVVGIMKINAVLRHEEYTRCKVCNDVFVNSSIRRHLWGPCKNGYTLDDMKTLAEQSRKRKISKQSAREKRKYDPEARAKRHKNSYDSQKRKEKYDSQKRSEEQKESMKNNVYEERKKRRQSEWIESMAEDSAEKSKKELEEKARDINTKCLEDACLYLEACREAAASMNLTFDDDTTTKIECFEKQFLNLHDRLEIEIDICADNSKPGLYISTKNRNFSVTNFWKG